MNATDDLYQVIYKCETCGKSKAIDDTSLARIADEFKSLGWENVPVRVTDEKTEYIVRCPDCSAAEFHAERKHAEWCEVQDSMEWERTAQIW